MPIKQHYYLKGVYRTIEAIAGFNYDGSHESLKDLADKLEVNYIDALSANLRGAAEKTRVIELRSVEESRKKFDEFKTKDSPIKISKLSHDELKNAHDELENLEEIYRTFAFDLKDEQGYLPAAGQALLSEMLLYVPKLVLVSKWVNQYKDRFEQATFDREWETLSESEKAERIREATVSAESYRKRREVDESAEEHAQ